MASLIEIPSLSTESASASREIDVNGQRTDGRTDERKS